MDIFKILNNDLSDMNDEDKKIAIEFGEKLRDKIIDELVEYETIKLINLLEKDKEEFIDSISNTLINGVKGFNKMSTQLLINIYLEKVGQEKFIKIIEEIS